MHFLSIQVYSLFLIFHIREILTPFRMIEETSTNKKTLELYGNNNNRVYKKLWP